MKMEGDHLPPFLSVIMLSVIFIIVLFIDIIILSDMELPTFYKKRSLLWKLIPLFYSIFLWVIY